MRMTTLSVLFALLAVPLTAQQAPRPDSAPGWSEGGIMAGDLLVVTVLREPLLSFEQTIPVDGVVDFHRLGRRDVRGLTGEALRAQLVQDYSRYLVNPTIRVEVLRKVQVLGAVREPKIYQLHPTMTIADAIAIAGGALPEGRMDRVELRRDGQLVEVLLLPGQNRMLADSPIRSGDQLYVPERSFASRNAATMATAVSGAVALLVALLLR